MVSSNRLQEIRLYKWLCLSCYLGNSAEDVPNGWHEPQEDDFKTALVPIDRAHGNDGSEGFAYAATITSLEEEVTHKETRCRKRFNACLLVSGPRKTHLWSVLNSGMGCRNLKTPWLYESRI